VDKNKEEMKKLNRINFYTCAEFAKPNNGIMGIGKEVVPQWQEKYSKRLCQNMYKLLAMVDIELMMFTTKLNEQVNNDNFFGFLHWDEKHVRDVDLHNFKLSRMFAFARNLTIRFIQLSSIKKIFLDDEEYSNKTIDEKHYFNLLHQFNERAEQLLELISYSTKFKTAQKESFWSWLKDKKGTVLRELNDSVKDKKWFQKDYEMLIKVYESMELGLQEDKPKLNEIYGKEKAWYEIFKSDANNDQQNGMLELFTQSPWFFPRIHKMVDIFAQIRELDGHDHLSLAAGHPAAKGQIAKHLKEEVEIKEHPEFWKLIGKGNKLDGFEYFWNKLFKKK
jgi:hypothetical protein